MIIRSDEIKIHNTEPTDRYENCFRGIVKEIYPSEYGMEVTVDAGEKFNVDISADNFKLLDINELSEVWITFPVEAGIALQGNL
jgi:hypothetical protein